MLARYRSIALLTLALLLTAPGCTHYRDSLLNWRAGEHSSAAQWAEVPLGIAMGTPLTILATLLYPFDSDKLQPTFVEMAAITALAVDPSETVMR